MPKVTPVPEGTLVNYFSGSTTSTHSRSSGKWVSYVIINDHGSNSLTVDVGSVPTQTIAAGEKFDFVVEEFDSITITGATISYRLWLRE